MIFWSDRDCIFIHSPIHVINIYQMATAFQWRGNLLQVRTVMEAVVWWEKTELIRWPLELINKFRIGEDFWKTLYRVRRRARASIWWTVLWKNPKLACDCRGHGRVLQDGSLARFCRRTGVNGDKSRGLANFQARERRPHVFYLPAATLFSFCLWEQKRGPKQSIQK